MRGVGREDGQERRGRPCHSYAESKQCSISLMMDWFHVPLVIMLSVGMTAAGKAEFRVICPGWSGDLSGVFWDDTQ